MVLHGYAYQTNDLDICYSRPAQNLDRLVAALSPFEPRLRVAEAPEGLGLNFTLQTGLGNLDLLGRIDGVANFDEVLARADLLATDDLKFNVLSIDGLIAAKRAVGRPKDMLVLPELEMMREVLGVEGET